MIKEEIKLESATPEEMLQFAQVQGLELKRIANRVASWEKSLDKREKELMETRASLMEALISAGHNKFIYVVRDDMMAPEASQGAEAVPSINWGSHVFEEEDERWIKIMLNKSNPDIPSQLPVEINGERIIIRANQACWVRERFVHVIMAAEDYAYAEETVDEEELITDMTKYEIVQKYPMSIYAIGSKCVDGWPKGAGPDDIVIRPDDLKIPEDVRRRAAEKASDRELQAAIA